jgi:hypothetical protein
LIKIHSLLILYQLYLNFNNLCEEAKIIFVLIIHFGDGVWATTDFFSAGDDRALVGLCKKTGKKASPYRSAEAHCWSSADFSKTAQIGSNSIDNMCTVTYKAPIKIYAQTTPSVDGVSANIDTINFFF